MVPATTQTTYYKRPLRLRGAVFAVFRVQHLLRVRMALHKNDISDKEEDDAKEEGRPVAPERIHGEEVHVE